MPIRNLIPPVIAHHSVPLYAIPTGNVEYGSLSLSIYRGADLLNLVETIDYSDLSRIDYPLTRIFDFRLQNDESVTATITGFTVSGNIELFSSGFEVGTTLATGETKEFQIETITEVPFGLQTLEGQFEVRNTYTGQPGEEIHIITLKYTTKRVKDGFILSQPPLRKSGKLSPGSYSDDFTKDLNRIDNEQNSGTPRLPGSPNK